MYNENSSGKISSINEDKQEHKTNTKKKKPEGNLEQELEKIRNDIKVIKKVIMSKNKYWLETDENTWDSQKEKIEKGKEEESQHKIQKESKTKENMIK